MKLFKIFSLIALVGLSSSPAWAQAYSQPFTGTNAETYTPAPFGNVYGADSISAGRQSNGLYIMFNDSSLDNPSNAFVGGYFQRFGTTLGASTRDFTGMTMSIEANQIPVSGVTNPSPGAGYFAFSIAFDANGDGIYNDMSDTVYRTNLSANPYSLPGAGTSLFSIDLNPANFQFDAQFGGQAEFWDLTKVSRIGFVILQNIPENGNLDFPDDTNLGWRFDNLNVAAIPEPGAFALMAVGLAGLAGFLRRRK